jgi:hypothetical protein
MDNNITTQEPINEFTLLQRYYEYSTVVINFKNNGNKLPPKKYFINIYKKITGKTLTDYKWDKLHNIYVSDNLKYTYDKKIKCNSQAETQFYNFMKLKCIDDINSNGYMCREKFMKQYNILQKNNPTYPKYIFDNNDCQNNLYGHNYKELFNKIYKYAEDNNINIKESKIVGNQSHFL